MKLKSSITFFIFLLSISLFAQKQKVKKNATEAEISMQNKKVTITNCTSINSAAIDFSPAFYQNGLVFVTSNKKAGVIDEKINEHFFDLEYAPMGGNHLPLEAEDFSLEVNSQYHEGPVTFSKDGKKAYFTSNNQKNGFTKADNMGKQVKQSIYEAKHGFKDWEEIERLPFCSDSYSCFHPSLSEDGKDLYFSSDMPGGYGGFDIYVVELKGKKWGKPRNLGAKINTKGNDAFPFIHESGKLFFASNGQKGLGGLDIYMTDIVNSEAGEVQNLGAPFNTAEDDFGFILDPQGRYGYFASSRSGGLGKDDIYLFETEEQERVFAQSYALNSVITTYDEDSKERVSGAAVRIFEQTGNGLLSGGDFYDVMLAPAKEGANELTLKLIRKQAKQLGDPNRYTTAIGEANYEMRNDRQYLIIVTKDGYESREMTYSTKGKEVGTLLLIDVPMKKQGCAVLTGVVMSEKFNTLIPNALIKVTNLTTQKTQALRSSSTGLFETCLDGATDYTIQVEKDGYKNSASETMKIGTDFSIPIVKDIALMPIAPAIITTPIEKGTVLVLENIYYDFNKAIIRSDATQELDALGDLMRTYKSMEIELVAHTDSRGGNEFNQKLSEQRAFSAKNYLVGRGIAGSRIKYRGAGESQLRNQCADGVECDETLHQYNRRTEVKVLKIDESVKVEYAK